jgi:hypothetical protein
MIWGFLKDIFKWESYPHSVKELTETWLSGKGPQPVKLTLFVFAGFAWAIWNNRNKMCIEHKFPKRPADVVYVALSYMQKWEPLLREDGRLHCSQMKDDILRWMKDFTPSSTTATDVGKI